MICIMCYGKSHVMQLILGLAQVIVSGKHSSIERYHIRCRRFVPEFVRSCGAWAAKVRYVASRASTADPFTPPVATSRRFNCSL